MSKTSIVLGVLLLIACIGVGVICILYFTKKCSTTTTTKKCPITELSTNQKLVTPVKGRLVGGGTDVLATNVNDCMGICLSDDTCVGYGYYPSLIPVGETDGYVCYTYTAAQLAASAAMLSGIGLNDVISLNISEAKKLTQST